MEIFITSSARVAEQLLLPSFIGKSCVYNPGGDLIRVHAAQNAKRKTSQ
jgi:hypothetical protein